MSASYKLTMATPRAAGLAAAALSIAACFELNLGDGGTIGFGVPVPEDWGDYEPAWSPDGLEIAVSSTRPDGGFDFDIHILDLRGQSVPVTEGAFGVSPSWSPDGLTLAFTKGSDSIYTVRKDGSELTALPVSRPVFGDVAWSPDGETIAFASASGAVESHIFLLSLSTSQVTQVTEPGSSNDHVAWSPDGTQLVFRSLSPDSTMAIYRVGMDGSNRVQLTDLANHPREPAWSPCGTMIAFTAHAGGKDAIHLMSAAGTDHAVLTDTAGDDRSPSWSPDCWQIAFSSDRSGDLSDIWIINVDGSGLRKLTVRN